MEVQSKEWYITAYAPDKFPTSDHLKLRTVTISLAPESIPENHIVLQNLWLSVEPFLRAKMTGRDDGLHIQQYELNKVIQAFGIGKVIKSKDENYKEGDIIINPFFPVAEYCVIPSDPYLRKLDPTTKIPLPEYIASLGVPGFAAWVGIVVLGEAKEGSNVFISAAAGGVGMVAGQLAKLKGCRVIGSTGSDQKMPMAFIRKISVGSVF